MTYRVEITRDETRRAGGVSVDITAYTDRVPETEPADIGRLVRVPASVWNSRLLYAGDFDELDDAIAAIVAAYPDLDRINCYEYPGDYEYALEMAPLVRTGETWAPGEHPRPGGPPPRLDWRVG
jgi:hypothetical protein